MIFFRDELHLLRSERRQMCLGKSHDEDEGEGEGRGAEVLSSTRREGRKEARVVSQR